MIRIKNAYKAFKETIVFENMNIVIDHPGMYVIQGESGSGKSTLLNLLAGYEKFDQAEVSIDTNIATIFQNYELIETLTVKENIFLVHNEPTKEDLEMIAMLGIDDLMNHRCNELSGGQMQRVGIARALILHPNIILCDEPTESLDIENKIVVMELLKKLSKTKIVILASHDQNLIHSYGENIYKLENHKLVPSKMSVEINEFETTNKKKVDKKRVSSLIHKLLWKKTFMFSVVMTVLIVLSQGLYIFQKSLFYLADTTNTVNADMVYIKVNDLEMELESYGIQEKSLEKIVPFTNVRIKDKEVLSNVYPYVDNELPMEGHMPAKDEILINQNVAKLMGEYVGESLDFVYLLDNKRFVKTYTVCGVVKESDTMQYNFYYDLDSLYEELKGISRNYKSSYYDYLMKEGKYFQYHVQNRSVSTLYGQVEGIKDVVLENPLYEERIAFDENSKIYRWLFMIFEGVVLVAILLLMVTYLTADVKWYMGICSIMVSMQVPIKMVKMEYIKYKVLYFIPLCLLSVVSFIGIYYAKYQMQYIDVADYELLVSICLGMMLLYLLLLVLLMRKFKQYRISEILKDRVDL